MDFLLAFAPVVIALSVAIAAYSRGKVQGTRAMQSRVDAALEVAARWESNSKEFERAFNSMSAAFNNLKSSLNEQLRLKDEIIESNNQTIVIKDETIDIYKQFVH